MFTDTLGINLQFVNEMVQTRILKGNMMKAPLFLLAVILCLTYQSAFAQIVSPWSTPKSVNPNANSDMSSEGGSELITDGLGNWMAVWSSNNTMEGTTGSDFDIFYALYDMEMDTWSDPKSLNTNSTTDSESDRDGNARLATDGFGNWIAVWVTSNNMDGTTSESWNIVYALYDMENDTWSNPSLLDRTSITTRFFITFLRPQITTDGQGNWIAVWGVGIAESNSSRRELLYALYDVENDTWSEPLQVSTIPIADFSHNEHAQVVTDGLGNWMAVWVSRGLINSIVGNNTHITYALYDIAEDAWSEPALVNSNAAFPSLRTVATLPLLTTDRQGNWIAIWQDKVLINGRSKWSLEYAVYDMENDIWSEQKTVISDIEFYPENFFTFPVLTTDSNGAMIAVWNFQDGTRDLIGYDQDIAYSIYDINNDQWSPSALLNVFGKSDFFRDDFEPLIATDELGNWIVAWTSQDVLGGANGTDLDFRYAHTTTSALMRSGDGGGGGGGCFIASAAYGTPLGDEIYILREFRDAQLLNNALGTSMANIYYRTSPPIANLVSRNPVLASIVRSVLTPIIVILGLGTPISGICIVLVGLLFIFFLIQRNRRHNNFVGFR